jgi:DNA-binding transcriptional MerR regulator
MMTKLSDEGAGLVSIGQLAKAAGVSSRTIRYYEELGILPQPRRSPGGTRMYPREYGGYIAAALALKDLGFRLDEVKPLARLAAGRALSQGQRDTATRLVEARLEALARQVTVLRQLHASVRGTGSDLPVSAVLGKIAADPADTAAVVPQQSDGAARQERPSRWDAPVPAAHESGMGSVSGAGSAALRGG